VSLREVVCSSFFPRNKQLSVMGISILPVRGYHPHRGLRDVAKRLVSYRIDRSRKNRHLDSPAILDYPIPQ
jgi:hypothetical protein